MVGSNLFNHGMTVYYWSSNLYSGSSYDTCGLYFLSSYHYAWNYNYRYYGLSVRAVCPAAE